MNVENCVPVAVGTALSDGTRADPHVRNYRIRLQLRVFDVEAFVGIRMQNSGLGNPVAGNVPEALPGHPTSQSMKPGMCHLAMKTLHRGDVAGHAVVIAIATQNALQPSARLWDRSMTISHQNFTEFQ